jgi:NitT/TauT family transport system substrate-binding protein
LLADRFRAAHSELTRWIGEHPSEAMEQVRKGISDDTGRPMAPALVARAWGRIRFTDRVDPARFAALVANAQACGFLRDAIPLDRLFSSKP